MATKITAAHLATGAGVRTVITEGRSPRNIHKILAGEPLGTQFEPQLQPINARKRWIAHALVPNGILYLDNGAVEAISKLGKSLLAAGIIKVQGEFHRQDAVKLCDSTGREVARGLVNYSSSELQQIQGRRSQEIKAILGYLSSETIVHRDNLVLAH
jgi:glutamate 5-kinase